MEMRQKSSKRKVILIALAVTIIVCAGFVGVYVGALKKPLFGWPQEYAQTEELKSKDVDTDKPSDDEKQAGDQAKTETIEKDKQSNEPQPSTTPIQVTLTASGRNGDIYQLRYLIDNAITSGACKLTLTKGSQTVTQEAAVQVLGGSSTCAGFNIPMNSVSSGEWKATITVTSGDRNGTSTDTVSI